MTFFITFSVFSVQQGEHGAFQVSFFANIYSLFTYKLSFLYQIIQKLERGEIKLHDFYKDFGSQLSHSSNKEHYKAYLAKSGKGKSSIRQMYRI